ncbi:MAG: DALR anticodon-binding domain-containing protein, partial [Pseudomonadota bacterium]
VGVDLDGFEKGVDGLAQSGHGLHGGCEALFEALDKAETKIAPAMDAQDFTTAMQAMATLRQPIDAFFEAVQINADNQTVRRNRLNLLSRIRTLCLSVADLTKIEG